MLTKENINQHNLNWPQSIDHPCRILTIEGSGTQKANALLSLTKQQDSDDYSIIDKFYLKDIFEAKYQYLIKTRKKWC